MPMMIGFFDTFLKALINPLLDSLPICTNSMDTVAKVHKIKALNITIMATIGIAFSPNNILIIGIPTNTVFV